MNEYNSEIIKSLPVADDKNSNVQMPDETSDKSM